MNTNLKPGRDEINEQGVKLVGGHLSTDDQADARLLVRQLFVDKDSGFAERDYPELDEKLAAVVDYEAKQILACLARYDALDQDLDKVAIQGLVTSEENNDRLGWAKTILSVLYTGPRRAATLALAHPPRCCPSCYHAPCVCRRCA